MYNILTYANEFILNCSTYRTTFILIEDFNPNLLFGDVNSKVLFEDFNSKVLYTDFNPKVLFEDCFLSIISRLKF